MTAGPEGLLIVDKEAGLTSAQVVARVRRLSGIRRVGHTGTLDPFATGVLPVCLGRATAAATYMLNWDKAYQCQIRLGFATDTMDSDGQATDIAPGKESWLPFLEGDPAAILTLKETVASLASITCQQAPLYSAVKIKGKPLYKYAREGKEVERPVRPVTIYESSYLGLSRDREGYPLVAVRFLVSSGTYIRSLADQLGRQLGCFAHAASLRRLSTGHLDLSSAVRLDTLTGKGELERFLQPVTEAFRGWPQLPLTEQEGLDMAHGRAIPCPTDRIESADPGLARLAPPPDMDWLTFRYLDRLVAVGRREEDSCRPRRVFITPEELRKEKR
ncbi:MAG: tRNA pseudouridine(55) synthase TruB [Clostridiaceae bacterium]|jgi:tRNA pseudouridine55 synthase|nr:tRNA pseudouridine(55) synthase TruB [Clostridiaceae bacterium]